MDATVRVVESFMLWRPSEEAYLAQLNDSALRLCELYTAKFVKLRDLSTKFRLPAIMIGATASAISFGTSTFPLQIQGYISVIVGTTSLMIAIVNTIESYLEISKSMTASLMTSTSMKKLSDDILCELALEVECRETSGIFFLRTIYTRYQQIITSAPPLDINKNGNRAPGQPSTKWTGVDRGSLTGGSTGSEVIFSIPKEDLKEDVTAAPADETVGEAKRQDISPATATTTSTTSTTTISQVPATFAVIGVDQIIVHT